MDKNTVAAIILASAFLASIAGPHVFAQSPARQGAWQMVAGSGSDGGNAWKFNTETGQSFFCYRQNCAPSGVMQVPARP